MAGMKKSKNIKIIKQACSTSWDDTHTPTRAAGAESSRIVEGGPNVGKHALHITRTGIGLWPKNRHTFNRHNTSNAIVLYLPFHILYNFNIFNILTLGNVIPRLLNGVCTEKPPNALIIQCIGTQYSPTCFGTLKCHMPHIHISRPPRRLLQYTAPILLCFPRHWAPISACSRLPP
jgi:hypothetical protein